MQNILKAFFLILVTCNLFLLSACGFKPMYGQSPSSYDVSADTKLAQISIGNIPDREGQYLRNLLIDRFYKKGRPANPVYILEVKPIQERETDLDITIESEATRAQLKLSTSFTLKNAASGETLLTREAQSYTSFNVLGSQFTTRVSEEDAREAGLNDLARQIELQLSLYFNR